MKDYYWVTSSTDMSGAPVLYITEDPLTDTSVQFVNMRLYLELIEKYSKAVDTHLKLAEKYMKKSEELDKIRLQGIM